MRKLILDHIRLLGIILSITLITLNIWGVSLSVNDLKDVEGAFRNDCSLSYEEYSFELEILQNEYLNHHLSKVEFAEDLTYLVSDRFLHKTFSEDEDSFGQRIRIYDNWILYLFYLFSDKTSYFYDNPNLAAKRGIGQCSQQAHVLMKLLKINDFNSYLIGLSGHTVTGVLIDNREFIMDADYGLMIPVSIDSIQEIDIENYYSKLRYIHLDSTIYNISIEDMKSMYMSKDDNWRSTERTVTVGLLYQTMEYISLWLKWLIPIVSLVLLIWPFFSK